MNEMEQFLKSSLLETLLDARGDEYETLFSRKFKESRNCVGDAEQELLDELIKAIPNKEQRKKIQDKIDNFEDSLFNDYENSIKRLYKLGFMDGYNFKREIKEILDEESRKHKN